MFLPIDPNSGLPIYRQIIEQVKRTIASGALQSGDRLPSVRELSALLEINPLTVQKAYRELEREDVLEMRRGRGMFVATAAAPDRAKQSVIPLADRLVLEAVQARLSRAETLDLIADRFDQFPGEGKKVDRP